MKTHAVVTTALLAVLAAMPADALAQGARLRLDTLDKLARDAEEVINIDIDRAMLELAAQFLPRDKTKELAVVKEILSDIKGIYVRVFEFSGNRNLTSQLEPIRQQLTAPGWTRLINVEDKRGGELVEIYSFREKDQQRGIAVLVADGSELTVVNIDGPIDPAKIGLLQGQFGIPKLPELGN